MVFVHRHRRACLCRSAACLARHVELCRGRAVAGLPCQTCCPNAFSGRRVSRPHDATCIDVTRVVVLATRRTGTRPRERLDTSMLHTSRECTERWSLVLVLSLQSLLIWELSTPRSFWVLSPPPTSTEAVISLASSTPCTRPARVSSLVLLQ